MPAPPLADLLDPARTAVVLQECQRGVLGDTPVFPALAQVARERGVIDNIARLLVAARAAGVTVAHTIAERRDDLRGSNSNARIYAAAARSGVSFAPGSDATLPLAEFEPTDGDLFFRRLHGIGPMYGTDLDPVLRNLGIRSVVAVGVSVNVGLTDLVFDCCNAGYQVVLPTDAVAGVPAAYGDAVVEHTLSLLATPTSVADVIAAWA